MEIVLNKKVKNPTIIEGFPGIGLVGTIATEFLIESLKAKEIGYLKGAGVPPMVALHNGKVSRPMGIYYAEKQNLLIIHFLSGIPGKEWELAEIVQNLAKNVSAKEIVSLESVGVPGQLGGTSKNYYYSTIKGNEAKLKKLGASKLENGIVMGITSILIGNSTLPLTCLFGETHTKLPDSKAAASILGILNTYLNLKIDTKPLLKSAEAFEKKLKGIIQTSKKAQDSSKDQTLSYLG
jgi:uncharacterized protein